MGVHRPISHHMFTLKGNVLTGGSAKNLAKGQFTIVSPNNGSQVVSSFAGMPADTIYEMRLGKHNINSRTAMNGKPYSSHLFKIADVVGVKANFPRVLKQRFDSYILGYDGVNDDTALSIEENSFSVIDLVIQGDPVAFTTNDMNCQKHFVRVNFERAENETMQEVTRKLVERFRNYKLPAGTPLTDLVSIDIVDSANTALTGVSHTFSSLTLTDDGTTNALALVQAQYPNYQVVRTERNGLQSVYTILHPTSVTLDDYVTTFSNVLADCGECPEDYATLESGVVYSIKLEDDGANLTSTVQALPGAVTGSAVKHGQSAGVGTYSVVLDNVLTSGEFSTFVTANPTATINLLGNVNEICFNRDEVEFAWVAGTECFAQTANYKIQLADGECDDETLTALQAAYPNLTIRAGVLTGNAVRTVTVANDTNLTITVGGVEYTTNDAGTTTQTATAWVAAHAAAILTATGVTVTSNTNVITFTGATNGFPTIVPTSQTLGAITYPTTATTGGCQGVYSTSVTTNIVCEDCDDIFLDYFTSEAPEPFDFIDWELINQPVFDETALMGIRFTGKPFIWTPTDVSRDQIPFFETSTRIASLIGGYVEDVNESFEPIQREQFNVKRLSRALDRDNLGGNLMSREEQSRTYFDGVVRHKDNLYAKAVLGEESVLDFTAQYVSYEITIHDSKYSQSIGGRSDMGITYTVWAEYGRHEALQTLVNKLAAKANVEAVTIQ